ncbi:hypothetical protein ACHMW6_21915 [Pseudoduganella sp. UC29_106]|uniref:hypothetical protein n=1 Tax=Pseudoduganella sp. UC29_106 TaxID=3374553 RepID=UPI0037571B04
MESGLPPSPEFDNDNRASEDGRMNNRVSRLEVIAADVLACLAKIEATMATRDDLHRLEVTLIKWVVGTVGGVGIALATVMTFVLNNAGPRPAPSSAVAPAAQALATPPIVIVIPPGALQWQAQPPK